MIEEHGPVRRKVENGRRVCSPQEGHAVCGGEACFWKNQAESVFPREDWTGKLPSSKLCVLILPHLCPD